MWLTRCHFSKSDHAFTWACGLGTECLDNNTFPYLMTNPEFIDITGLVDNPTALSTLVSASITATSGHTSTSTVSEASCPTGSALSNSTTTAVSATVVGASVGVPLAVLFLATLASTLWYRRKWIKTRDDASLRAQPIPQYSRVARVQTPMELAEKRAYHAQLDGHSTAVHELGGRE